MDDRATQPLPDVLPALLEQRGMSLRSLAAACEVDAGFLSRVVRRQDGKSPSPELAAKIAVALALPDDYFLETRRGWLIGRLAADAALVDRLYEQLRGEGHSRAESKRKSE